MLSNIEETTLLDILESWKLESVHRFLTTRLKDRTAVELVCVDIYHPYRSAVQAALPQATIIVDKFHVLRLASWAVERVRRDIQFGLPIKSKRTLMSSKRLLAKRWDALDSFQRINLVEWFNQFPLLISSCTSIDSFTTLMS